MKDKIYFSGLTLILLSFVACVISYWLLAFGIPIYIIGAGFIFVSKKAFKTKLIATILPVMLYFPFNYIFLTAYNYTSPKTILIPAGYEGTLRIIYEEECGIEPRKENGRQILKFAQNGILILKTDFDGGLNNDYYLVDENGIRQEINQPLNSNQKANHSSVVLVVGSGTFGAIEEKNRIVFTDFYIIKKEGTYENDFKQSQKFDSLTSAIVNICRKEKGLLPTKAKKH